MNKKLLIAAPALALTLLVTTTACATPATETTSASPRAAEDNPIVGEWTMRTLEFQTDGEFEEVPFSGQIIFTEAGTVAVQAQNPDAAAPDTAYTVQGYEAFYGAATIEPDTFSVEVQSAAARDLIGQTLVRNYEVVDDTLVLTPVDVSEGWRVTYDRATD